MSRLREIIARSHTPATITGLIADLTALGVREGMTLMVHSSLSRLGYVVGGAAAVVLALEQTLGPSGTLAMPTHTSDLSDPGDWSDPPVPETWVETIRQAMPPFQVDLTPCAHMGAIPEAFRCQAGTLRSNHPLVSWAARGPHARQITANHGLSMSQGETSPLARLYELEAWVLLLGVGFSNNTCFHLAEYRNRFADRKRCTRRSPVLQDGQTRWVGYEDIYWYDQDFPQIGAAFEAQTGSLKRGRIGQAETLFFPMCHLVDFAVKWMNAHRSLA